MTNFKLEKLRFTREDIDAWAALDPKHRNWPVVYLLNNNSEVYVGESLNATSRMRQHLESADKKSLESARVILDETFNKSACLDLESYLIRLISGDGQWQVLNSNAGVTDSEYFNRQNYQKTFDEIFEALRADEGIYLRSLPEIINSDLFKLSPFKALNHDQAIAVEDILKGLFDDLEGGVTSVSVVQGSPGTGKTVVAIYLMKLLEDIRRFEPEDAFDMESIFSDYFTAGHSDLIQDLKIGLVVPQQSLRESIGRVFKLTPGLNRDLVLTPFEVGSREEKFDLLVVDEAHRLNQRANQPSGVLNKKFVEINEKLFGADDLKLTQLDWIIRQSRHTILMVDQEQSVRPADLPTSLTRALVDTASKEHRLYPLVSQMRVRASEDYVGYVRQVLSDEPPAVRQEFADYDLRFFDDFSVMRQEIFKREEEHGLARLVAGFAWPWSSKKNRNSVDIDIDSLGLQWNSTPRDWINSHNAVNEVGSIHTVQGYDLNYAGVIIGNDLKCDPVTGLVAFNRSSYFDVKGREDNKKLGIKYSDSDLLAYVRNIYSVLLTRGILGTYVYVVDPELRKRLRAYF